jgi:hypothetical protein
LAPSLCVCVTQVGYFCPAGSTSAIAYQCVPGQYSLGDAAACTLCPAGKFGSASGLSVATCSGDCFAGYACAIGSTSGTQALCAPGTFSAAGAGSCSPCSPGFYGNLGGQTAGTCVAACPAGTFGTGGSSTPACSGNCTAGYACPAGSTSATQSNCTAGSYSLAGASTCTPCPGGTFGATATLSSAACSGNCTGGYACVAGSTSATAALCPAGKYSLPGSASCTDCPPGTYGATAGLSVATCSGQCAQGGTAVPPGRPTPTARGPAPRATPVPRSPRPPPRPSAPRGRIPLLGPALAPAALQVPAILGVNVRRCVCGIGRSCGSTIVVLIRQPPVVGFHPMCLGEGSTGGWFNR